MNDILEEREMLKCRSTGRIFELKKRTDHMVILQSLDRSTQVFTGKNIVFDLFEKILNYSAQGSEMIK